jgi:hypothetical protein
MFLQNTAVHHHEYSIPSCFLCSLFVNDPFLHPDRSNVEADRLLYNFFDKLGPAEDIDDVDLLRHLEQRAISLFSEAGFDVRVHRNDAISLALHIGGNAMTGAQWVRGKTDHSYSFRAFQQRGNRIFLREARHGSFYFLLADSIFCLYNFNASLRTVSETSLLAEMFFKSCTSRYFIKPNPRSSGVRGFDTKFLITM